MRIVTIVVAMILVLTYGSALADCPGNVFTGEPRPKGAAIADTWVWILNAKTGEVVMHKRDNPNSQVTGHVDMRCSKNNKWSARLTEMSHGVKYNCNGKLSEGPVGEGSVGNGRCTTNEGDRIDLSGTFSTR